MDSLKLAVITGGHVFEVPPFHRLFRNMQGIETCIQTLEDWGADVGGWRNQYDVLLFYNMHKSLPALDGVGLEKKIRAALEELKSTRQGIILLHHALLAFPDWDFWNELAGMPDRTLESYHQNQALQVQITKPHHPITLGQLSFEILDETYRLPAVSPENDVLLTTDHPKSLVSLGWSRKVNQSRVFCLALGHDHKSWENPAFQKVLFQGIHWTARQTDYSEQ